MIDTIDIKWLNMPEEVYYNLLAQLKNNSGKDGYKEYLSVSGNYYSVSFLPNHNKKSVRKGINPLFKIFLIKRRSGEGIFYSLTIAIKLLSLFDRIDGKTKTIPFDKLISVEEYYNREIDTFKSRYNIDLPLFVCFNQLNRVDFTMDIDLGVHEKQIYLDIISKANPKYGRKKVKDCKFYVVKADKKHSYGEQTKERIKSIRINYRTMNFSIYDKFFDILRKGQAAQLNSSPDLRIEIQLFRNFFRENKYGKQMKNLSPQEIFKNPSFLFECCNELYNDFFYNYLKDGDYYSMRKAKKIIEQSSYRKTTQEKLKETMRTISRYGIGKAPMMTLTKRETFKGYINKLKELNINPVPIKKDFVDEYHIEYLPNLKNYLENLFIS